MKQLLKLIFGNGTRSVQAINLSANVVWFVLLTSPIQTGFKKNKQVE